MPRRILLGLTVGMTALTGSLILIPGSPAQAATRPGPVVPFTVAAEQTAPCDPDGTTAADAALAARLNTQLQDDMRGYMSAYRASCARMVVDAVRARGLSSRAAVIAITTTIVETHLQNVSEMLDHTSLGLFQQQNSWGTAEQRLDPTHATNSFLSSMLDKYPNNSWQTKPIGEVCQGVQVSAYPDRYQVQAGDAQLIVNALWTPPAPPPPPIPQGPLYFKSRTAAGVWSNGALVDDSAGITRTAAVGLPNNTLVEFNVIPGSGIWSRTRSAAGGWGGASLVVNNGAVADVAAAAGPDGSLTVFGLIPGTTSTAGIYALTRSAAGAWAPSSVHVADNGSVTSIAATASPDGSLTVFALAPGTTSAAGIYALTRSAAGSWAPSSVHIAENGAVTDLAAAALPDGTLNVFALVPGAGIYLLPRNPAGTWASSSTHVSVSPDVTTVSAAASSAGVLYYSAVVPGDGVYQQTRTNGSWAASSEHVESSAKAFETYTVALPNNTLNMGVVLNAAA